MRKFVPDLLRVFAAGRVRRWHANPEFSWTDDYIDGHSARVARILLALHPVPTVALIAAALTHDDGEWFAGDAPFEAKRADPEFKATLDRLETVARVGLWGNALPPSDYPQNEANWVKFADRLDAYFWARAHRPAVLTRPDWVAAADWLHAEAAFLMDPDQAARVSSWVDGAAGAM